MRVAGPLAAWLMRARPPVKLERLLLWGGGYDSEESLVEYLMFAGDVLRKLRIIEVYMSSTMDTLLAGVPWSSLTALESFMIDYASSFPDTKILALLRALRALPALRHLAMERHPKAVLSESVAQFDHLFRLPGFPALCTLRFPKAQLAWEDRLELYPVCAARGILVWK
ncbi:hypothetical protein HGRIS_012071 [Hohenbuehelia grisea]|uniref:Uncharacterized protein n=1 Tax=Hohenbuehelia grisea TaxID=104357 RepID=A0ABR3IR70_9AGAR